MAKIININTVKQNSLKNKIYQFRIDIKGAKPPIWRRVLIEKKIDFSELHAVIQSIFDWENYHLHQFKIDEETIILNTEEECYEQFYKNEYNEFETKLTDFFKEIGDKIEYVYDFGDNWEHTIKLEKILDKEDDKNYPFLVTGKKMAPFEDSGGIWEWRAIYAAMKDEKDPNREEFLEYYNPFDPDYFPKKVINDINDFFVNDFYLLKRK